MFSPYKLCVYSIVKDEMKNIDRYLKQVSEADEVVILDTGSTDGTYEYLKTKPNIKVYQKFYKVFRFDEGRNDALALTSDNCDIYISIEPDMILCDGWVDALKIAWNLELTYLTIPQYFKADNQSGIWKAHKKKGIRWDYPVFELPISEDKDAKNKDVISTIIIHDYDPYKESHKQYKPLAELGIKEKEDDPYTRIVKTKVDNINKKWGLE
jgi:glycosyltransferase involved in cell wall biosynthesis